ncbi:MAG: F-type H+-transporting ATPase subunit delta [Bacteroidia bacterium]|jgi:F-type H+-transporting ATPase subunit delta
MSSRVATRYAKSLIDLASAQSVDGKVYDEMVAFAQLAKESEDLRSLLLNPVVSAKDKEIVLNMIFADADALTKNFVSLVISRKRESELANIAKVYIQMYDQNKGVVKVSVKSAMALEEKSLTNVKRYIKGLVKQDDLKIENIIDSSVIGGIVIQFDDKLLDLSIAKELKEIRKQLIYN